MAKILVIRFSAIGDVAMTIPVIYSFAVQYPQHQITVTCRNPGTGMDVQGFEERAFRCRSGFP